MLKKSSRLTTKQLLNVMKNGKVVNSPLFILRHVTNQLDSRISAVAPVKVAKKAVVRNRVRRRMYGALREFFPSVIPGIHAIIFSKNDLVSCDFETVRSGVKDLLIKAKLMK